MQKIVVEVRFDGGLAYLDHVGTIADQVLGAIDRPRANFNVNFNYQEHKTELTSAYESIAINYGTSNLVVTYNWEPEQDSAVPNLEATAKLAWDAFARAANVANQVRRVGNRFWIAWTYPDKPAAEAALRNSGLVATTSVWDGLFSSDAGLSLATRSRDGDLEQRVAIEAAETKPQTPLPPAFLREGVLDRWRKGAVVLDIDFGRAADARLTVQGHDLARAIRTNWLRVKTDAEKLTTLLRKNDNA